MPRQLLPLFAGASGNYYQGETVKTDEATGKKEHTCAICQGIVIQGDAEWNKHVQSAKHLENIETTRDLLRRHFRIRDQARSYEARILQNLPSSYLPWQDAVFAKFGRALVQDDVDDQEMAMVEPLLEKYELFERISLLELAVWKGICCGNCPDHVSGYFQFQKWLQEGWRQHKSQYYRCQDVCIIMKCVVPFLELPDMTPRPHPVAFPSIRMS